MLGKNGRNRENVWEYSGVNTFRTGRDEELQLHATCKPVALVRDAILDCTRRGDLVLDGFLGSGTTAVAAEQAGRRSASIEIDPHYVDVALARLRREFGFTAYHEDGRTFDEVARDRQQAEA